MTRLKSNGKIIGMLAMLSIMVIGLFSVCAQAASKYGKYVVLTGSVAGNLATTTVENYTSVSRYMTLSLKDESNNVIVSKAAKVGGYYSMTISNVGVTNYAVVQAHCTVYNSIAPASGTAESFGIYIK